jgi:hypothetical protein
MSACAKTIYLARVPLENSAFHPADFSADALPTHDKNGRAGQIKQVLRQAGLTMSQVSAVTDIRYGKKTPYFVPPTFLYKQKIGVTPHVCQIAALSQVTGYRFADWMNLCGFDLDLILTLQLKVHTERTVIVTPSTTQAAFDSRFRRSPRLQELHRRYLFAKIGSRDNVIYPKVLPGSIVRADRCYLPQTGESDPEDLLWLVEHPGGLACCHVKRLDQEHVLLLPSRPPLSSWPLRLSREARILGLVDLELCPRKNQRLEPMYLSTKSDTRVLPGDTSGMSFSKLLRASRSRTGSTLRAAHRMTLRVAELLHNREYAIPLGLLSDYEAMDRFPRHIAKIISLCVIYGIDFWELMEAGGSHIDESDKTPLLPARC